MLTKKKIPKDKQLNKSKHICPQTGVVMTKREVQWRKNSR